MKLRPFLIALLTLTSACMQAQDEQAREQTTDSDAPVLVVSGVDQDDVLNVRAEPNANARLVGTLSSNASNIRVTAQATGTLDWIHIEANGVEGWVNASYLSYANAYEPLPIRLHCSGTEPFWGLELSYSRADVSFAFNGQDFRAGFDAPISPPNQTNLWLRTRFELEAEFLVLRAQSCSDGMSDLTTPYSLVAKPTETFWPGAADSRNTQRDPLEKQGNIRKFCCYSPPRVSLTKAAHTHSFCTAQ